MIWLAVYAAVLIASSPFFYEKVFFWFLTLSSVVLFGLVTGARMRPRTHSLAAGFLAFMAYIVASSFFVRAAIGTEHLTMHELVEMLVSDYCLSSFFNVSITILIFTVVLTIIATLWHRKRKTIGRDFFLGCLYWGSVFGMPLVLVSSLCYRYFSVYRPTTAALRSGYLAWIVEPIAYHIAVLIFVVVVFLCDLAVGRRPSAGGELLR